VRGHGGDGERVAGYGDAGRAWRRAYSCDRVRIAVAGAEHGVDLPGIVRIERHERCGGRHRGIEARALRVDRERGADTREELRRHAEDEFRLIDALKEAVARQPGKPCGAVIVVAT